MLRVFTYIPLKYYFLFTGIFCGFYFLWLIRKKHWSFYVWFPYVATAILISLYGTSFFFTASFFGGPLLFLPAFIVLIPVLYLIYYLAKKTAPSSPFKSLAHILFVVFCIVILISYQRWDYNHNSTNIATICIKDQYNKPVPNVLIRMNSKFSYAHTDEKGFAFIKFPPNKFISLEEISRKGYEFEPSLNTFHSLRRDKKVDAIKNSTEQEPVIIYLRKMGQTTYLYHDEQLRWKFQQPYSLTSYNIYRRGLYDIDQDLSKIKRPEKIDLIFEVRHDIDNSQYMFKVISPLKSNGVQFSDNKLYAVPVEGYMPEATITINLDQEMEKYLYFSSRRLAYEVDSKKQYKPIYSRMKIEVSAREDSLKFLYDTWTNPYGSPHLEYEPDMPFDLRNELRLEAKRMIQSGKLPPEPNLQEMMDSRRYN